MIRFNYEYSIPPPLLSCWRGLKYAGSIALLSPTPFSISLIFFTVLGVMPSQFHRALSQNESEWQLRS